MTPEEIKTCLADRRKQIHALPLPTKGKGYSFWLGLPANDNRIIRASRDGAASQTRLKLAVTDRLSDLNATQEVEFPFAGSADDLLRYVDQEIALFASRIQKT